MDNTILDEVPKFYGAVTVGERGQVVIPIEARKEFDLESGMKLLVFGGSRSNLLIFAKAEFMTEFLTRAMTLLTQFEEVFRNNPELATRSE